MWYRHPSKSYLILILGGFLVAVALLIVDTWHHPPAAQLLPGTGGIILHTPQIGDTVYSGETVHFLVEPDTDLYPGMQFNEVEVVIRGTTVGRSTVGPPFDVPVTIPTDYAGEVTVAISGFVSGPDGGGAIGLITLNIEPDVTLIPTSVTVVPSIIRARPSGLKEPVTAYATFPDDTKINISAATTALWTVGSNAVARVILTSKGNRFVEGLDYGATDITVTYRGVSGRSTVRVGISEIHGDLTGDGRVNKDDEQIIKDAFGHEANPEDPRDLNGDGFIDKLDLQVLQSL